MTVTRVWADDLTGAAEAAYTWQATTGERVRVRLTAPDSSPVTTPAVSDLDLRHRSPADAKASLRDATRALGADSSLFVKIDSQLRGPVRAYVEVLLETGRSVLLSAANPEVGRRTHHGQHIVTRSDGGSTRIDLRDLLTGLPHHHLASTEYGRLDGRLTGQRPAVVTADVASEDALRRLAHAVPAGPPSILVGSAPFLGAMLHEHRASHPPIAAPVSGALPSAEQILAVLGTTERSSHRQLAALRDQHPDTTVVVTPAAEEPDAVARAARAARVRLAAGAHVALTPPDTPVPGSNRSPESMAALAATCAAVLPYLDRHAALFLTGGHTARQVLDRLGLVELCTTAGGAGAVAHLATSDGRMILTKPGSYGDTNTLLGLVAPTPTHDKEPSSGHT